MPISVRCATVRDARAIARLLSQERLALHYAPRITADLDKGSAFLAEVIAAPSCFAYVIERDGRINGAMVGELTTLWWSDDVIVADKLLCVTPSGKGGGINLIREFIKWGRGFDAVRAIILSNSMGDQRVNRLYQSLGFVKSGGFYMMEVRK